MPVSHSLRFPVEQRIIRSYYMSMKITMSVSIIIYFCLFFLPATISAAPPTVKITGDALTLEAKDTPLQTVLEELVRQGISVRLDPAINPLISASFRHRPLNTAFSAILKEYSYSLRWESSAVASSKELKLTEIEIFQQGQKERMEVLRTGENLPVVQGKNGVFHVKDTLLIRLNGDVPESTLSLLQDALGAHLDEINIGLGVIRLHLPDGVDVEKLAGIVADLPGIALAEPDYAYPLALNRSLPAAPQLDQETAADIPAASSGTVAVLDSGLAESLANSPFISGSFDAISPGSTISDPLGHGTQMSLIAAGVVSPMGRFLDTGEKSTVISIRAFDDNGFTSNSALLQGIEYAIQAGAEVLSMSWGTETKSNLLESAVQYAADKGLILVAAAGNTPSGLPVYPAAYKNVIGVGALMPDGSVWKDSNYGDFVTVYAPGLAQMPVGHDGDPGTYAGTSIAAAYVAHQIAEILAASPDADLNVIVQTLVSEKATGVTQ